MIDIDAYCGSYGHSLFIGSCLSPCFTETISAILLPMGIILFLMLNRQSLIQIMHASEEATASSPRSPTSRRVSSSGRPISRKGTTAVEGFAIVACCFMLVLHVLHLALSFYIPALFPFPFHRMLHLISSICWLISTYISYRSGQNHVAIDYRALTSSALVVYGYSIYSFFALYGLDGTFPAAYNRGSTWSVLLQFVLAAVWIHVDFKRAVAGAFSLNGVPNAYQALPSRSSATLVELVEDTGRTWISIFFDACSYTWPESPLLQLNAVLCILLLIALRVLNLAVPIIYKNLVDILAAASSPSSASAAASVKASIGSLANPTDLGGLLQLCKDAVHKFTFLELLYPWTVWYLIVVFFQGGAGSGMGLLSNLRSWLWISVSQDAYRRISLRVFSHMVNMDIAFHLQKKIGEVQKVVNRGSDAMQTLLSSILFSIAPQLIDVLVGSTYLAQVMQPSIAIIMFITVASYLPITIIITEWRGKLRRETNQADQAVSAKVTDTLMNYEIVKYFSNEGYEGKLFSSLIHDYQQKELLTSISASLLNMVQSTIMFIGLACGLLVCIDGVQKGHLSVGDVVLFISMQAQLYTPLAYFGANYRFIQQQMIDMENLFALLDKTPQVADDEDATDLIVTEGQVSYEQVSFGYSLSNPVIKDVSFVVPGGKTIAFVGQTGSGKSTLTRLLFRLYDIQSGAIKIDGQDIRSVTQSSLRKAIGMVPQDTTLFNDNILTNIRYGRPEASDEEVYEAARAACIDETIMTRFPDGYQTLVGERGLRLSGGEKQRVAFARASLKNSPILILDEATSALDSLTERRIQSSMSMMRSSRTTLIVAHRLSTIADADVIVVMKLGEIAEMGKHDELLAVEGGLYKQMWETQARDEGSSSNLLKI